MLNTIYSNQNHNNSINTDLSFCVYLTIYSGNKLPSYYIGSSTCDKVINHNYHGTVKSIKYGEIWKQELKENPDLFKTHIISTHETRREALYAEYELQKEYNVVKSEQFINMSLASKDGFIGMDTTGKNNPMYGKTHSQKTLEKMSQKQSKENNPMFGKTGELCPNYGIERTEEQKETNRQFHLGKTLSEEHKQKISESGKGRIVSDDTRTKIKDKLDGMMSVFNHVDLVIEMIHKDLYYEYKTSKYLLPLHKQYQDFKLMQDLDKSSNEYQTKLQEILNSIVIKPEHIKGYIKPKVKRNRNPQKETTKKLVSEKHKNCCNVLNLETLETQKIPSEEFDKGYGILYISTRGEEYKFFKSLDKNDIDYDENIKKLLEMAKNKKRRK